MRGGFGLARYKQFVEFGINDQYSFIRKAGASLSKLSLFLQFDFPWDGLLRGSGSGDPAMGTPLIILGSPEDGLRALPLVEA